jgi:hypothetical protein
MVAAISGTAGIAAKKYGLIKGVVIAEVVIENHGWLSTIATGALAAIGGILINESWKAFKSWRANRKTKSKN